MPENTSACPATDASARSRPPSGNASTGHRIVCPESNRITEPYAVITDDAPVAQVAFDHDGEVLVVAARALSTWRLPASGAAAEPEQITRHDDVFATTLAMSPSRVAVGTATHELISFALGDDGSLTDRKQVDTLLDATDSTTTWQLPERIPSDDELVAGGDTTGNVYVHSLDLQDAREWVWRARPR
ncbi:hypothetical protein ACN94_09090 [Gordonia paraffinivorans]|uniref:hypothetical protein n=1 Tax=Gordonia paraffinivorans TaxID=175628 RepID=UPI001C92D119|nr:hypothetical protein [Gordonia paraffinivorans]MBY4573740.1 hypothetical protein [Gordonia paraffinivorans]